MFLGYDVSWIKDLCCKCQALDILSFWINILCFKDANSAFTQQQEIKNWEKKQEAATLDT